MENKTHKITITLEVEEYTLAESLFDLGTAVESALEDDDLSEVYVRGGKAYIEGWEKYRDNL